MGPAPARAADGVPNTRQPTSRKRGREQADEVGDEFGDVRRAIQAIEATFITIHDISPNANILYTSASITDILDWRPEEVVGRSAWDFFHPNELPFARAIHSRSVQLDKASVLNYCRIKGKSGEWIGCECVFTVVYNVLIGCTSVYMDGPRAKKRAVEAPIVRQLFSSSPRDPRYHMLSYISSKFSAGPRPHFHEPRAALFLNRFTRTLTINFATNGLENLLGVNADDLMGKSFYYCIQPNCLAEAIRCLESAKANDSIAYLRFWFRDPTSDEDSRHEEIIGDAQISPSPPSSPDDDDEEDEDGGVRLTPHIQIDGEAPEQAVLSDSSLTPTTKGGTPVGHSLEPSGGDDSRHSSGHSTDIGPDSNANMFDQSPDYPPSTPSTSMSIDSPQVRSKRTQIGGVASIMEAPAVAGLTTNQRTTPNAQTSLSSARHEVELEAVVSCTSDGLVVILRAARPFLPDSVRVPPSRSVSPYSNGLFASPWAASPIMPDPTRFPQYVPAASYTTTSPPLPSMGVHPAYSPPPPPNASNVPPQPVLLPESTSALHAAEQSGGGPPLIDFMNSIRDVAVFAWALTGINGSLQSYARGRPFMGAVPYTGLPVWDPDGKLAREERDKRQDDGVEEPSDNSNIHYDHQSITLDDAPAQTVEKGMDVHTDADSKWPTESNTPTSKNARGTQTTGEFGYQ